MENFDLPQKKKNPSEEALPRRRSAAPRFRRPVQKKQSPRSPRRVPHMETPRPRRSSDGGTEGDIAAEVLGDDAGAEEARAEDPEEARAEDPEEAGAEDPEEAGAEEEVLAADAHVVDVAKAATEAARRARQHRQSIIEDVPRFCIGLGVTKASFHRLMVKRFQRMLLICSMILGGHPVTPPLVDGRDTFHIVEILRGNGEDSVEILFRESDLYFLGFRPRSADHNSDPKFYLFNDVVTPEWPKWLPYRILPYDSGYSSAVADITVGRHCFPSIFSKLFDFNPENYKSKTTERGKALQWTMIMLSETLRIRDVQQLVETTLESDTVEKIGKPLHRKIHSWARHSRDAFDDVSISNINWELKGCDGDLLTLKFSEEEALPVIIGQQKKVAAAVTLTEINSLIGIHFSANWQQLPNFHNCLILLLASEKICKDFPEDFPVDADLSELPIHDDIMQRLMQLFKYPYAILRKLADVKNPAVLSQVCKAFAGLKDIESEGLPSKVCHVLNDLKQLGVMIAGADAFPP